MEHISVVLAGAGKKFCKPVPPRRDAIEKRERHGCAFISKALIFKFNLVESGRESVLVRLRQGCVVATKKSLARAFEMLLDRGVRTCEPALREFRLARINL